MADAQGTSFRNFVWLWLGIVLVAASLLPLGVHFKVKSEVKEIGAQAPALARIVTAERHGGRAGRYTDTVLEFQRQTGGGIEPCRVWKKIDGWSDEIVTGTSISVVPRSGSCYDPILPGPQHRHASATLVAFFVVLAAGIGANLVWFVKWRRERSAQVNRQADRPETPGSREA